MKVVSHNVGHETVISSRSFGYQTIVTYWDGCNEVHFTVFVTFVTKSE